MKTEVKESRGFVQYEQKGVHQMRMSKLLNCKALRSTAVFCILFPIVNNFLHSFISKFRLGSSIKDVCN